MTTTPSTQIQISQVGARFIDRETNTSEVEIRPPREEMRTDIIHAHSKGIQVPSSNSELSSDDMNIIESPLARPHVPDTMLQLDSPLSVCTSTQIQISQVGARFIDRETNTSEVEIRPPREEMRTDIIHAHSKGIQVPSSNSELSSDDMNIIESPLARPHVPDTMLQLDSPLSVCTRRKRPVPEVRRYTTMPKGNYPDESKSDSHDNRSHEG